LLGKVHDRSLVVLVPLAQQSHDSIQSHLVVGVVFGGVVDFGLVCLKHVLERRRGGTLRRARTIALPNKQIGRKITTRRFSVRSFPRTFVVGCLSHVYE